MTIKEHIKLIIKAEHWDSFQALGMHEVKTDGKKAVTVRAFIPEADRAWVVDVVQNKSHEMEKTHKAGFFEKNFENRNDFFQYKLKVKTSGSRISEFFDPYSFLPVLSDFDLHLIGEGSHYKKYEKLGSHVMEVNGIKGIHFAVWKLPNAKRVSVAGDFNNWDGRRHQMRVLEAIRRLGNIYSGA